MLASYMPVGEVRGLGKISGTAVSFTDLLLGEHTRTHTHTHTQRETSRTQLTNAWAKSAHAKGHLPVHVVADVCVCVCVCVCTGCVLAVSNTLAGVLSDATRSAGYGTCVLVWCM